MSTGIRIALWNVSSENPNSPVLNGIVTIDGVDHKVSLWDNSEAEHPRAPRFKGKTSRPSPKDVLFQLARINPGICHSNGLGVPWETKAHPLSAE